MIACISVRDEDMEESIHTLHYASRTSRITNRTYVNLQPESNAVVIDRLQRRVQFLEQYIRDIGYSVPTTAVGNTSLPTIVDDDVDADDDVDDDVDMDDDVDILATNSSEITDGTSEDEDDDDDDTAQLSAGELMDDRAKIPRSHRRRNHDTKPTDVQLPVGTEVSVATMDVLPTSTHALCEAVEQACTVLQEKQTGSTNCALDDEYKSSVHTLTTYVPLITRY
uniref:Chromosome-associated kinesin KIF4 n=1 Tax=Lygus hesperus TaxID=30085 RepID=A0A0A9W530_LYGHE